MEEFNKKVSPFKKNHKNTKKFFSNCPMWIQGSLKGLEIHLLSQAGIMPVAALAARDGGTEGYLGGDRRARRRRERRGRMDSCSRCVSPPQSRLQQHG